MGRMGRSARAVYESHYTEERMLQAYRRLYQDMVSAKCPVEARTTATVLNWRRSEEREREPRRDSELVSVPREPKDDGL